MQPLNFGPLVSLPLARQHCWPVYTTHMTGEREAPGSCQHPAGFLGPGQDCQWLETINSCEQGLHAPAAASNGPGERAALHSVSGASPSRHHCRRPSGIKTFCKEGVVRKSKRFKEGNSILFFFMWQMSEDNELELGTQYPQSRAVCCELHVPGLHGGARNSSSGTELCWHSIPALGSGVPYKHQGHRGYLGDKEAVLYRCLAKMVV